MTVYFTDVKQPRGCVWGVWDLNRSYRGWGQGRKISRVVCSMLIVKYYSDTAPVSAAVLSRSCHSLLLPRWSDDLRVTLIICSSATRLLLRSSCEYPVASFFSCFSFIDWFDASWPHYTALESIGHRNETGEGHYQCRSHRAHSQWSGSIFLWLHC